MLRKLACAAFGSAIITKTCLLDGKQPKSQQRHAICILYPNNSNVRGVVGFSQDSFQSSTKIACSVKGLNPNGKHGFHIHQYGDLTDGCATTCAHFNPHNKKHGGPYDQERHVGDLGNITADPFGNAYYCFKDDKISLFGDFSIVGRAVVIHAGEDDLGKKGDQQSFKTGNAGPRIACGVIGLAKQFKTVSPN